MSVIPRFIETERLLLRPLTLDDINDVFDYASDPDVTRFMDWQTHLSPETSREWILETLRDWDNDLGYTWGITFKQDKERILGCIGCTEISFKISFGYVLNKEAWGVGIATEATTKLIDLLGQIPEVKRIWATCDIENTASANVLRKSGCTLEGTLRNWLIRPNLPGAPARDNFVFAKTKDA